MQTNLADKPTHENELKNRRLVVNGKEILPDKTNTN